MSRQILVIDSLCTNRILSEDDLAAARFGVRWADGLDAAVGALQEQLPDVVIAGIGPNEPLAPLMQAIRGEARADELPVIAVGADESESARLEALQAGADEVFSCPLDTKLLLARIRSLLRRQDDLAELRAGDESAPMLGFADEVEPFVVPGRVTILTGATGDLSPMLAGYAARLGCQATVLRDEADLSRLGGADLVILDAADDAGDLERAAHAAAQGRCLSGGGLFRAIAEVRAQRDNRHTEILAVVPPGATDLGVMALDLGASDLATSEIGAEELSWRVDGLLRRKRLRDRLRDRVRDGLKAAVTDPLTGLHNRRFAMPVLARLAEEAGPDDALAVMIIDIDHFKAINDTHGHAAGDRILAEIAARLRSVLRPGDLLARIGGEEFLTAAPRIDPGEAEALAEQLRAVVAARPVTLASTTLAAALRQPTDELEVTVSVGLALSRGESGDRLFGRADAALYSAKRAGRNRVVTFGERGLRRSSAIGPAQSLLSSGRPEWASSRPA